MLSEIKISKNGKLLKLYHPKVKGKKRIISIFDLSKMGMVWKLTQTENGSMYLPKKPK